MTTEKPAVDDDITRRSVAELHHQQRNEDSFRAELLIPHILLAAVLISLLIVSFIHYHIKYRRKAIHLQYHHEYLHHVANNADADVYVDAGSLRSRRVSIPMVKVMRRYSQGQYPATNLLFCHDEENGSSRVALSRTLTAPATIEERAHSNPNSPVFCETEFDAVSPLSAPSGMITTQRRHSPPQDLTLTPTVSLNCSLSKEIMTTLNLHPGNDVTL